MANLVTPMPMIRARFFDDNGRPLSGGKIYTYEPNTTTPKTTYKDLAATTPNTNPILLDVAGEADIYFDGLYRVVVQSWRGEQLYDKDNVGSLAQIKASFVVDASGKTQQEINDSIAVKFLKASKIGLVSWAEFKKPPYTTTEYDQAYNNGLNLAAAIKAANDEGYSYVVLERGNYPFCYNNLAGINVTTIKPISCEINGVSNLVVDLNGATLFVIFDSNNRSPYDKATTIQPYQLPGVLIGLKNNTNLTFKNGWLRGDQYNRSWVSGEKDTEQTYGINTFEDNINVRYENMEYTGFRGDGLSSGYHSKKLNDMDVWNQGGVSDDGVEIAEAGSYRTPKYDLNGKTIYRNSVQIGATGNLKEASFRNDLLSVFFYNSTGAFISKERCRQTDRIYLPKDCRYIQFVSYDDERTAATVDYGLNYLMLVTGTSDISVVDTCRFYANHRGGISNLTDNTTIDNCDFYDNGSNKYGFLPYADSTRYGVNFEDIYVGSLTVTNSRFRNLVQGLLGRTRNMTAYGNKFKDITNGGVGVYVSIEAQVNNNLFDNVGIVFSHVTPSVKKNRHYVFSGNIVKNSALYQNMTTDSDVFWNVSGNTFDKSRIDLQGNGSNLLFNNNVLLGLYGRYTYVGCVRGALTAIGNTLNRAAQANEKSVGWSYLDMSATKSSDNIIILGQNNQRLPPMTSDGLPINLNGVLVTSNNFTLEAPNTIKGTDWTATNIDKHNISDCTFDKTTLLFGTSATQTDICDAQINIKNSSFAGGGYIYLYKSQSTGAATTSVIIKDTDFDLTNSTYLIRNAAALAGSMSITFLNCTFISDTAKSIAFIQGQTSNITATATNCTFINVVNTDSILQIAGAAKTTYDPPSLANGIQQSTTVTLNGAKLGDNVSVSFDQPLSGTRLWGEVTSANTVTVYHRNDTGVVVDVASGTLTVKLI